MRIHRKQEIYETRSRDQALKWKHWLARWLSRERGFAIKPYKLSLIPGTHIVVGEKWPSHIHCGTCEHVPDAHTQRKGGGGRYRLRRNHKQVGTCNYQQLVLFLLFFLTYGVGQYTPLSGFSRKLLFHTELLSERPLRHFPFMSSLG